MRDDDLTRQPAEQMVDLSGCTSPERTLVLSRVDLTRKRLLVPGDTIPLKGHADA